ncbi:hypothetical protein MM213_06925 [Belliella sp. R4-6]|uniref:Uncharacterized protein n=1 Tax=Belliella alkalica TaxID=1730871 RepID=A0ABS9V9W1_9BACT|nr:hypothetical protein [Belliella alkalica]MCH7413208.1 hypothetical protein [Belliella alkalica]
MNNLIFRNTSTKSLVIDLGVKSIDYTILGDQKIGFENQFTRTPKNKFFSPLLNNIDTLKSIKNLPKGWNGENTFKFSEDLIQKVYNILSILTFQPEIFPTGRNSIQLEFEREDNYLEFEIFEDKIIALIQFNEIDEEKEVEEIDILNLVEDFYASELYI